MGRKKIYKYRSLHLHMDGAMDAELTYLSEKWGLEKTSVIRRLIREAVRGELEEKKRCSIY